MPDCRSSNYQLSHRGSFDFKGTDFLFLCNFEAGGKSFVQEYRSMEIYIILISAIISAFGTIVGFGGGIFLIPILVTIFDYKLSVAVGSVMLALVPSSMLTTWFNREGRIDFKMGVMLELPTIAGTILGAFLLSFISAKGLESIFAILVMVLGASFFVGSPGDKKKKKGFFFRLNKVPPAFLVKNRYTRKAYRASLWLVLFFGGVSGVIAGLFGVGGGFLKTPIMVRVFKMPVKIAAATALFMIIITSVTGTMSHLALGHIQLEHSWPVATGFILGAILGKQLNTKISESGLEKLIGLALILAALIMLANIL